MNADEVNVIDSGKHWKVSVRSCFTSEGIKIPPSTVTFGEIPTESDVSVLFNGRTENCQYDGVLQY